MQNQLSTIIQNIEEYCNRENINHRFVGGVSFGGLLNKQTTYQINIKQKTIHLKNHNPLLLLRSDNTVKDIDLTTLCSDQQKIKNLKTYIMTRKQTAQKDDIIFPEVSIENAIYTAKTKRSKVTQFVTALKVDKNNNLFLTFDDITQQIYWESIEPWTIRLEDKTHYTVRNPMADYYAYQFRSPAGIKPKDKEKLIYLKLLTEKIKEEGKRNKIYYTNQEYFAT